MDTPFKVRKEGLYCSAGDFYIDAFKSAEHNIVTHAHGDHARWGHKRYYATPESEEILRLRLGKDINLITMPYGEKIKFKNCWVSLHPAGHILGSAQVRIEIKNKVYVASGDYKRAYDSTCLPFEVVECDLFITESTFGLPIYRWEESQFIAKQIMHWWEENKVNNHPSVLFCYALGKSQRVLGLLADLTQQPIYLHGAVYPLTQIYKNQGVKMAPFEPVSDLKGTFFNKELIIAPPSAAGSPWLKRFPEFRTASASGWMQVRGTRRQKGMDHGFILSDHADWNGLIRTIEETKAKQVLTTHGSTKVLAQYLREIKKLDSIELQGLESIDEDEG